VVIIVKKFNAIMPEYPVLCTGMKGRGGACFKLDNPPCGRGNSLRGISKGDVKMGSNRKQTELIRARKSRPNKANLKKNQKRIQRNVEILRELASNEKT
jgi:hypothetical protein